MSSTYIKDKKIYTHKVVKPEAVSFIIGKNGCHIKEITSRIKNGSYIVYDANGHKFTISSYSKSTLNKLIKEIEKLENEFNVNRKKYLEYRFKNRPVDHSLVTEIIKILKEFAHSPYTEYKGDNLFVISSYSQEQLEKMLEKLVSYDKVLSSSPSETSQFSQWMVRRDFKKIMEEIVRQESLEEPRERFVINSHKPAEFSIENNQEINDAVDNYIDKEPEVSEIELDQEDYEFVTESEKLFVKTYRNNNNPFYQLSRDHPHSRKNSFESVSSRRLSDL